MFNQITIVGYLVEDPELRDTSAGPVCSLRLGFDGRARDNKAYINAEAWGKTAEACKKYLVKGRSVAIGGGLKMDTWDDKQSGAKRSALILVADQVKFLSDGKKQEENGNGGDRAQKAPPADTPAVTPDDEDDVPF